MSKEEKNSYGMCWCFRRRYNFRVAEPPQEIKEIFERYSDNGIMSLHHFQSFMKEVQGEDDQVIENDEPNIIMEAFINLEDYKRRKGLNHGAFFRYLLNDINSPLPSPPKVHHDMTAPLSHYFIYTGHNSYLTGNQLNSDCSDIPIIDALHRGVRVIELDLWPNSTKDDVHVLHGGTLTTPVELIKCLNSIKAHAFVTSEYPVILTLEDHLTSDLQAKVAKMLNETFGDALFCSTSEKFTEFPSPESLKKNIVISTKLPKEYLESGSTKMMHNKLEAFDEHHYDECVDEEDHKDDYSNLIQNHCHAYKKLIAIPTRKRNGGVEEWLRDDPNAVTRVSLREHNLENAVIDHAADVVRFTQRNLLRIFPKGSRLDSSNYNPMIGWTHGAQMVAFNMQGHGKSLWLMQGLFRANGGCGYVRKPVCLLNVDQENEVFDPSKTLPVKQILKLKIYMGEGWHLDFNKTHFDLYSPPDFYVKVGVVGVQADSITKKTKVIKNNWIPTWNEEFEFPLTCPELALLRIEVEEYDVFDKDDFGGQTCLPVSELKTGIRAVSLHNHKGDKYKSVKLLMRFQFV